MASKMADWMKERDAKNKQKQLDAARNTNEHSEWMQQRDNMAKRKEAAEIKAKQEEENKPEFMKNLKSMKERAQDKPKRDPNEGPTIEDLDDGTDIPPWHRPGTAEYPEWVVQLMEAAKNEGKEEDGEEDHVLVAPTPSLAPKQKLKETLPPKQPQKKEPEWIKQAESLKKAAPRELDPTKESKEEEIQQPWMKHILKPKTSPQPAKATRRPAEAASEQPEWMLKRDNLNASISCIGHTTDRSEPFSNSMPEKPEWMKNAARLQKKAHRNDEDTSLLGNSISSMASQNLLERQQPKWAIEKSSDNSGEPEWIKNAALLKNHETEGASATQEKSSLEEKETEKPWLLRNTLKPRIDLGELRSSKIQERLQNKPELKSSSFSVSKKDLLTNTVTKKLANRPSITEKKSPVNKEEMEFMKKKLKPRSTPTPNQSTPVTAERIPGEKPEWMKRASTLQQASKGVKASASEDQKEEKTEKPWLMRNKLKPRVSLEDLKSSKVQEKLENKPQLRKSSVSISKRDLMTNKVTEKLANRSSITDKKAPVKREEMEWMKKKLKSRPSTTQVTPAVEIGDTRPSWMKEKGIKKSPTDDSLLFPPKKISISSEKTNETEKSGTYKTNGNDNGQPQYASMSSDNTQPVVGTSEETAQSGTSALGQTHAAKGNEIGGAEIGAAEGKEKRIDQIDASRSRKAKTLDSTPMAEEGNNKAQVPWWGTGNVSLEDESELEQEELSSCGTDPLGLLSKAAVVKPVAGNKITQEERMWNSMVDFDSKDSDSDSDSGSGAGMDTPLSQVKSSNDFVERERTDSGKDTPVLLVSKSSKDNKAKSRRRSISLDCKGKKKSSKHHRKDKKKNKDSDEKKQKKKKKEKKEI